MSTFYVGQTDYIAQLNILAGSAGGSTTTATTQAAGDSSTLIATTAFVTTADNLKAPLASPTFTGTPTLPTGSIAVTQAVSNNTTALATTAFVKAEIANDAVAKTSATGSAGVPSGTTAQRDVAPVVGYMRYNSTTTSFEGYNGTIWGSIGAGGATGASTDKVFYENDQTVTTSYSITAGKNAMSAGPVAIATSVVVSVPTGSSWLVL